MMSEVSKAAMVHDIINETKKNKSPADTATFSRILFTDAIPDDLAPYRASELAGLVQESFAFIASRKPGRPKIRIKNPEGTFANVTVIEIVNDDMPFLVDSVLGLLTEQGFDIQLMLHPVLHLLRDASGALIRLEEKSVALSGLTRESYMHIHVSRIEDTVARELETATTHVLSDVRTAVLDWSAMMARLKEAINLYRSNPPPLPVDDLTESVAFLQWLLDNHFTFLGMRDYRFEGGAETGQLQAVQGTGLGILSNAETQVLRRGGELVSITPAIRSFLLEPTALIITKSDVRANVHRRAAMDYVGVKLFGAGGDLEGELRIVGLFTSTAYTQNPSEIPLLRRKIGAVISASGFNPSGHSGKALINVLETLPRDELFQIDTETLSAFAHGILRLEERPRTRVLIRRDRFDRSVSAFVFIPRDRFNSDVRQRVGDIIAKAFNGRVASFAPFFGESTLVRVHFIILRHAGDEPQPDLDALEQEVIEAVRTWDDRLQSEMAAAGPQYAKLASLWRAAFPLGYRDTVAPAQSLKDIAALQALPQEGSVAVEFIQGPTEQPLECRLRLYRYGEAVPLSHRLPILENMGLSAIEESTFDVNPQGAKAVIHDVLLQSANGSPMKMERVGEGLKSTFMAVWDGRVDNDFFNSLTLRENVDWRDIAMLRAGSRYLRQVVSAFTTDYVAATLVKHSAIAAKLVDLFHSRFNPATADEAKYQQISADIEQSLTNVPLLDEDRIIRRYLNLFDAMLRTNFFQAGSSTIAFKVESKQIEGLPQPHPLAEIFVSSPDVEGVHLRFGRIARGGIRWSDRPEDFRTEILGLAKAQNVKNVVIVPVGAKGGFVPRKLPASGPREAIQAEGIRAYKLFISSLLDITDNLDATGVVPPRQVVRRDVEDPYLVVAADKGTATFSDIANGISAEHNFWLDDAFASGGSAGYDHKKMAITARGAWEAVKRHFRELDMDIQSTPFSVIGIGDMSGDVFGNGMLLSRYTRLLAAFDHRDIFIDPDPDINASFEERARLFALSRSSWQDYDKTKISEGGGVFSRLLKSVRLSPQVKALTGIAADNTTPQHIINRLLQAEVDLIWFGGIGTFVKSSQETHADAGDRTNDGLRVDATQLRAKVVGEGANLALTQRARIEFALRGGCINTDAIDNSAGVNSSDLEVNIKIALRQAETSGKLTRPQRNDLLAEMTDEVGALVLRNNYLQTLCLSLCRGQGTEENGFVIQLMHDLEERHLLDRQLEALPRDTEVLARDARHETLTRPEFAVLLAYSKIALYDDLLKSTVPDDEYLSRELMRYFPAKLTKRFESEIKSHRLRREIVSTLLANSIVNRGGPALVSRLVKEAGARPAGIAAAFAVARDSFSFTLLNQAIDELDARIPAAIQTELYLELQLLLRRATLWFLRNTDLLKNGLHGVIQHYRAGIDTLESILDKCVPEEAKARIGERKEFLVEAGIPSELALRLSRIRYLQRAPDIVQISSQCKTEIETAARTLYAAGIHLEIDKLLTQAGTLVAKDFFERLAINRLMDQVLITHRGIAVQILTTYGNKPDPWALWAEMNNSKVLQARDAIGKLVAEKTFDLAKLAVAQGVLSDLASAKSHATGENN